MHTYRLKIFDHGIGWRQIEFDADNADQALAVARQQAPNRTTELWCDGQLLCVVREATSGFWQINPVQTALA